MTASRVGEVPISRVIPLMDKLVPNFEHITQKFEKEFICGLAVIIGSGKCQFVSEAQFNTLIKIYARVQWLRFLPKDYKRSNSESKESKPVGITDGVEYG